MTIDSMKGIADGCSIHDIDVEPFSQIMNAQFNYTYAGLQNFSYHFGPKGPLVTCKRSSNVDDQE